MYKREYLSPSITILLMGFILIPLGMILHLFPYFYLKEIAEEEIVVHTIFAMHWISALALAIVFCGVVLMVISIYKVNISKKKLQLAFKMKHNGLFDEVFDVDIKDIKNVKRIWIFDKEKEDTKNVNKRN